VDERDFGGMVEEQERQSAVVLDPGGLIIMMSVAGMVALVIVARCLKQQGGNLAIVQHSLIGWHPEDDASRWIASCHLRPRHGTLSYHHPMATLSAWIFPMELLDSMSREGQSVLTLVPAR
jgi:hypothetical protein